MKYAVSHWLGSIYFSLKHNKRGEFFIMSDKEKENIKAEEPEEKKEKKGPSKKTIILVLGSVAIICAAVIIAILLLRDKTPDEQLFGTPGVALGVLDMENVDDIMNGVTDKVEQGMFVTHMNLIWSFPDSNSPSTDAVMGNSAANNYAFWFTISVSGDVVFTSGLMPTGTQISQIKLDKTLSAGTYPAVVHINMVDDDGNPVESNMGISVTLVINS